MTQEEKQLLLKDLCARLPYGVICLVEFSNDRKYAAKLTSVSVTSLGFGSSGVAYLHCCKPYLRPMLSMTEEERKEFIECAGYEIEESPNGRHYEYFLKDFCGTPDNPYVNTDGIDWLLSHHFDFRGLIEKGLALEASEDMYKEK